MSSYGRHKASYLGWSNGKIRPNALTQSESPELENRFIGNPEYEGKALEFLNKHDVTYTYKQLDPEPFPGDRNGQYHDTYLVSFSRAGKKWSVRFHQSIAEEGKPPTPYEVISGVEKSDPGSFEDFVGEFGYSTDEPEQKRDAMRIYKAVQKEYEGLHNFFTESEIEEAQEIA